MDHKVKQLNQIISLSSKFIGTLDEDLNSHGSVKTNSEAIIDDGLLLQFMDSKMKIIDAKDGNGVMLRLVVLNVHSNVSISSLPTVGNLNDGYWDVLSLSLTKEDGFVFVKARRNDGFHVLLP
ncbi:hypothetical protein Tco_0085525 [Tanacetum coccineum]